MVYFHEMKEGPALPLLEAVVCVETELQATTVRMLLNDSDSDIQWRRFSWEVAPVSTAQSA